MTDSAMDYDRRGALYRVRKYERSHILLRPDILVIFGDNLLGTGFGGQAEQCRGLFNCLGVPVKHFPDTVPKAFFRDEDFYKVAPLIGRQLELAEHSLKLGRKVAYPFLGIGTGRAALQETSPKLFEFLKGCEVSLFNKTRHVVPVNNIGEIPYGV